MRIAHKNLADKVEWKTLQRRRSHRMEDTINIDLK